MYNIIQMERCTDLEQLEKKGKGKAPQSTTVCIESFSYTAFNRSAAAEGWPLGRPRWRGGTRLLVAGCWLAV